MTRMLALLPLALVVAACGGGSSTVPKTAAATQAPAARRALHVTISAESHHPRLRRTWTYRVRVADAATGKPVAARIHLQFLFNGVPVGEVGRHRLADGTWEETIPATGKDAFPPAAVGQPLFLHVAATAKGYRPAGAGWTVKVVR